LKNILRYLKGYPKATLKVNGSNVIEVYCDASFNLHHDGKGHSGCLVKYGGNCTWISKKQKVVTSSSFESEFVCLFNSLFYVMELRNFLREIGECPKVIIYEDNAAVLAVIKNGTGCNGTSKHMNVKIGYVKQVIEENNFEIKYLDTKNMIADILTKPIVGKSFLELRERLFEKL